MAIRVHTFGAAWGIADPSPFCLKLLSFLREVKIPYEPVPFDPGRSFRRAPKGKLPFVELDDGSLLGDSSLIIGRLSATYGRDLDAALDRKERATAHAMRRMLDEHFYWVGVYSRWLDEPGWQVTRAAFFARMPIGLRAAFEWASRRRVGKALHLQGLGRHRKDEIYAAGEADLAALARLLGGDDWFFGKPEPTLLDLWCHAFIAETIWPPIASPLKAQALRHADLVRHAERLQARLYPELPPPAPGF